MLDDCIAKLRSKPVAGMGPSCRLGAICRHVVGAENRLTPVAETSPVAAEAEAMQLTPISEHLGMNVEGVDLKRPLSKDQVAAVYDALVTHKVLVFKRIGLSREEQVRFTYELSGASDSVGPPTIGHTVFGHSEGFPEVYSVMQGPTTKPKNIERYESLSTKYPWTGCMHTASPHHHLVSRSRDISDRLLGCCFRPL